MNSSGDVRPAWFVGYNFGGNKDQSNRFLSEGFWEISKPKDKERRSVLDMQPGDRIALKSTYTRSQNLPFDNHGRAVSVMAIKAVGTIVGNSGDGERVRVDWQLLESPREWYFYTYRSTIWRVLPHNWRAEAMIRFTFEGAAQQVDSFRNAPYWRERFGDLPLESGSFDWVPFFEALATKLDSFRDNRAQLLDLVKALHERDGGLAYLRDTSDGGPVSVEDICPFTTMGILNRRLKHETRKQLCRTFGELLEMDVSYPNQFTGIPILDPRRATFFYRKGERGPDDIGKLWGLFEAALLLADEDNETTRARFIRCYDAAQEITGVGWNLTMGLFWMRPHCYPTLDGRSRELIDSLQSVDRPSWNIILKSGREYLSLKDRLEQLFQEEEIEDRSFFELSRRAYGGTTHAEGSVQKPRAGVFREGESEYVRKAGGPYTLDSILEEDCFIPRPELEQMLQTWRDKRNLILQGPPGTGKTWLATRLAQVLIGSTDRTCMTKVQFHPNLSYEDFVRGYRPDGDGRLCLQDGPFLQAAHRVRQGLDPKHVVIIEEINRGNPAQIFGELLTLLEADKRNEDNALSLSYMHSGEEAFHLPQEFYVIGTMNIADRSLALVDLALRRRFAFADLVPRFNSTWCSYLVECCEVDMKLAELFASRLEALNLQIQEDATLGKQFRIGHSFLTPTEALSDPVDWYQRVVEHELRSLLEEYWYEDPGTVAAAVKRLLDGIV
jgi:5-methylcytosine-specific restriction protein B